MIHRYNKRHIKQYSITPFVKIKCFIKSDLIVSNVSDHIVINSLKWPLSSAQTFEISQTLTDEEIKYSAQNNEFDMPCPRGF